MRSPTVPFLIWINSELPAFVKAQLFGVNLSDVLKTIGFGCLCEIKSMSVMIVVLVNEISYGPIAESMEDFKQSNKIVNATSGRNKFRIVEI